MPILDLFEVKAYWLDSALVFEIQLNIVVFPTFAIPTIPHFNAIMKNFAAKVIEYAVCRSSFFVHLLSFTVFGSSFIVIRYSLFVIRYSIFVIRYSLFDIRYSIFDIHVNLVTSLIPALHLPC